MRSKRNATPWLLGIFTTTLLFALLGLFSNFQYIGSDDAPILRSFMGFEGGQIPTFHLYLHTAFAWLLWLLGTLFSGVAWFSILQLFLLWFSQVVIVKSLVQLFERRGWPVWSGALLGAAYLAAFTVYVTCRITYTTTSALCGAAAVAQLASVDFTAARKRAVIGPMVGSALMLLCSYCLRQISVMPPLCFWLLVLAVKLLSGFGGVKGAFAKAKPAFTGVLITAVLFGLFIGVRMVDIRLNNAEDFLTWQNERIALLDYTDFDSTTTPETLQTIGWSENEFTLFTYWYFMDDNISTQALHTLNAQQLSDEANITLSDRLISTQTTLVNALNANPTVRFGLWAALAMAATAMVATTRRPAQRLWATLGLLCAVLGGALLLCYLAYTGRLPMRALVSVVFPMAITLYCALPGFTGASVPQWAPSVTFIPAYEDNATSSAEGTPPGIATASTPPPELSAAPKASAHNTRASLLFGLGITVLLGLSLWMTLASVITIAPSLQPKTSEENNYGVENMTDLDAYALENPETLFITDLSLVGDIRLFPDTSAGIPGNIMFWGGYPARSANWYRMLAKFGITELNASIFLRDNVLLASTDPEPWQSMMGYIGESVTYDVDWGYYDTYGYLNFFKIEEY